MYTQQFKDRVLKVYPDSDAVKLAVEEGGWGLGAILKEYSDITLGHKDIMAVANLETLQNLSTDIEERKQLYADWLDGKGSIPCHDQVRTILAEQPKTQTGQTQVVAKVEPPQNGYVNRNTLPKAIFTYSQHGDVVAIVDKYEEGILPGTKTVTNDMERVIFYISRSELIDPSRKSWIYKDTEGIWSLYDFNNREFRPLHGVSLTEVLLSPTLAKIVKELKS